MRGDNKSGGPGSRVVTFVLGLSLVISTGCSLSSKSSSAPPSAQHRVSLTWVGSTSSNVVAYNVYRGTQSGNYGLLHSMNPNTIYIDAAVQDGQTYYYVVTAVDSSGQESAYSNETQAAIP